jgi:hypothetical protein
VRREGIELNSCPFSEPSARRRITLSTVVPHTFPTRIALRTGQVWLVPFLV